MCREIVQIAIACPGDGQSDRLYAVCNDGSVFVGQEREAALNTHKFKWHMLPHVPQALPKSSE